jgi:hypothetical protein
MAKEHLPKSDMQPPYRAIPQKVLEVDKCIRFCGIVDKLGYLVHQKYRDGVLPIMSNEDNARYALLTTIRRRPRLPWKNKVGSTHYLAIRSENLIQTTIPLSKEYLMMIYFDSNASNYDTIIMEKILPIIKSRINYKTTDSITNAN